MKRNALAALLCLLALTLCFPALAQGGAPAIDIEVTAPGHSWETYVGTGKVYGTVAGDVYGELAGPLFGASEVHEFETIADGIIALRNGRIDVFVADYVDMWLPMLLSDTDEVAYLTIPLDVHTSSLAPMFATEALRDDFNAFLAGLAADGTLDAMFAFWFAADGLPAEDTIAHFDLADENGTLRATIDTGNATQGYKDSTGRYVGYSVELTERFAQSLGMAVEWIDSGTLASVSYLQSGKSDMFSNMSTKTESRMQQHLYGDTVIADPAMIAVRNAPDTAATGRDFMWFEGKDVGINIGSAAEPVYAQVGFVPVYFQETPSAVEDVRNGRIAGFGSDLSAMNILAAEPGNADMEVIVIPASYFLAPMGAISTYENQPLMDAFNAFLAKIEQDGTLAEMQSRWFEGVPDLNAPMPDLTYTGEKGILKVATVGTDVPFDYFGANGELKGYAIELMNRFGADAGYTIEYQAMEFSAQIPAVVGGRADIAISCLSITEERRESVLFSDPVFYDQLGIIALKEGADTEAAEAAGAVTYEDFFGKVFAVKTGTIYDGISANIMQAADTLFFEDYASIYEAIKAGRADAGMRGYTAAYVSLFEDAYDDLAIVAIPEALHFNPVGAISMSQDTIDAFDAYLAEIRANGVYDEMYARWFDGLTRDSIPDMPHIPLTGENGTLTVAISSDYMPFSFLGKDGVNMGFDIELATRFAAFCGMDITFVDMAFSGLLPYVVSGKADLAISDIAITEERAKSVLFTEPYFRDLSAIIYREDFGAATAAAAPAQTGFVESLKTAIRRNLLTDNRWKMLVDGLATTMIISLLAQLAGTVLGCFLCWVLLRKSQVVAGLGRVYSGLIHGLPMVVLLMISYYIIFGKTDISAVLIAVCAFALVEAAGIAAILKGAIDTVDPVEIEAARSIGFTAFGAFRAVTLPQAIKRAMPAYCNGFIQLVKATAIVGYIAIQDLTRAGDIIRSRTYDAYFPLLFVALIYLLVTTLCVQLFKLIIKRINKEARR